MPHPPDPTETAQPISRSPDQEESTSTTATTAVAQPVIGRQVPVTPEWARRSEGRLGTAAQPVRSGLPSGRGTVSTTETNAQTPSLGPPGKRRSPLGVAVLSALSLGIYAVVWHRRINTEMRDFDPRMHVHPGRSTFAIAVPWVIGLVITIIGAARILLNQFHVGLPFDPHFTVQQAYYLLAGVVAVPYLELLLAFSAAAVTMTLERVRIVEERTGRTTDVQLRPTRSIWLLLIPFTGGPTLQHMVQQRLNAAWDVSQPSFAAQSLAARISQY